MPFFFSWEQPLCSERKKEKIGFTAEEIRFRKKERKKEKVGSQPARQLRVVSSLPFVILQYNIRSSAAACSMDETSIEPGLFICMYLYLEVEKKVKTI